MAKRGRADGASRCGPAFGEKGVMVKQTPSSNRRTGLVLVVTALALGALNTETAAAAEAGSTARQFEAEAAKLETAIDAAQALWREQDSLVLDLQDEARALETAYGDPDATAAELRKLEDQYETALLEACKQAQATITSRRRVYDQMDKLAELGRKIEAERRAILDAPMPGGLWRLEIPTGAGTLIGIMQLQVDGGTVRGSLRLSNGRRGTVSGTYDGGHLELMRSDTASGRDAALRADVNESAGTLEGEWVRFELGAGEPGSGRWTATRVSDESELPDLGEP